MISADDVRAELDHKLHGTLRDGEWDDLEEDHYVKEVIEGNETVDHLAERVRKHRVIYGGRPTPRPPTPRFADDAPSSTGPLGDSLAVSLHDVAVSVLLAEQAAEHEDVIRFRETYLSGGLLDAADVDEWIKARRPGKGGPVTSLLVLRYAAAGVEHSVPIDLDDRGPLPQLHGVAYVLTRAYPWQESTATTFVLTGRAPLASRLLVTADTARANAASARINLTVDPTIDPKEVESAYRRVRGELFGGNRYRPLSEKHIRLAMFPMEGTPAEDMARWNRKNSDWKYDRVNNFARDRRRARERLLEPFDTDKWTLRMMAKYGIEVWDFDSQEGRWKNQTT